MQRRSISAGGRAFDASGASGLTFLSSQLELINTTIIDPLQDVTHARDIPFKFGGGWVQQLSSWATNYGTTGGNQYGLQGTNNTDVPLAQIDIQKGVWSAFDWQQGMLITYADLKRFEQAQRSGQTPPFSMQALYEACIESIWLKALDRVSYLGWLGQPGLINNTNIPEFIVPVGAQGYTTWVSKTGNEILNDVNTAQNQTVINSGYNIKEAMADTIRVPYSQFAYITQPMTIAGCSSIKEYIEKYCVAVQNGIKVSIEPLPNPWISGMGSGGTDRAVVYKKHEKSLLLQVPVPKQLAMTVPTTRIGAGWETIYNGVIGQLQVLRGTTAVYMDGI